MDRQRRRALRPVVDRLENRYVLSALSPTQLATAYGLNAITYNVNGQTIKGDGTGQTIAIIDAYHDPYLSTDLTIFDQTYHLASASLTQVNLAGSSTNSGWATEEDLDVEWAHAIAPGAKIVVVEARSSSIQDLMTAVNVAKSIPGVSVVSMSWGGSESRGQTSYDSTFTTPAGHTGITYVASSGDQGAGGGAQWPSSSPNVLSVGGTTLSVSSSGTYLGESVWAGSSSGSSRYESEPSYQRTVQSSGVRTTPDVSFDGDPNTGVLIYTTNPTTGRGLWEQVGGTSLGAPAWSAIVAIADEGRALAGKGTLNSATQTMTALYSLPASDFHKVSTASAGNSRFGAVASAGLGTPNGAALVNGLVAYGSGASSAIQTTSTSTATAATTTQKKAYSAQINTLTATTTSSVPNPLQSFIGRSPSIAMPVRTSDLSSLSPTRSLFDAAIEAMATESVL